ncbi:mitochondrial FAD-linked sulfhydryl oxidase ERV1-like [Lecanosticta acicola]|uniref:Sulfhydryl oxidase n=1 Tax=Lecanosticta acicola TaxID=111012 RepID=A0AAI8YV19_9PEZI|nr:mitochondrial FAD-linked sulfhydryl oxidase ERV1-like [Lecanosticta acicola]
MPITQLDFPILLSFNCAVQKMTGADAAGQQQPQQDATGGGSIPLPKGVVLGPDGKPCRTCTSSAQWRTMMGQAAKAPPKPQPSTTQCPADVEELGRSTWTFLHTLTANYPERPSFTQQAETRQFLGLFGKLYPCWHCAEDFRTWMSEGNAPRVSNREEFGRWMCEAHNAVNVKLGKKEFDCGRWEERWRTGWKDGRCD